MARNGAEHSRELGINDNLFNPVILTRTLTVRMHRRLLALQLTVHNWAMSTRICIDLQ